MSILLADASQSVTQVMTFGVAALLMIVAGLGKRRLGWRRPNQPRWQRWFRRGGRPPTSQRPRR